MKKSKPPQSSSDDTSPPTTEAERHLEDLYCTAGNALAALLKLASAGDESAVHTLNNLLCEFIYEFYGAVQKRPEVFRKLARHQAGWPGFITVDKDWMNGNAALIKLLQLGEDAPYKYQGKQSETNNNPNVKIVKLLVFKLRARERARVRQWQGYTENKNRVPTTPKPPELLPPLNKATYTQWYAAMLPLLERHYGSTFEDHPDFARQKANALASATAAGKKKNSAKSYILDKLKQTLKTMAKPPTKSAVI